MGTITNDQEYLRFCLKFPVLRECLSVHMGALSCEDAAAATVGVRLLKDSILNKARDLGISHSYQNHTNLTDSKEGVPALQSYETNIKDIVSLAQLALQIKKEEATNVEDKLKNLVIVDPQSFANNILSVGIADKKLLEKMAEAIIKRGIELEQVITFPEELWDRIGDGDLKELNIKCNQLIESKCPFLNELKEKLVPNLRYFSKVPIPWFSKLSNWNRMLQGFCGNDPDWNEDSLKFITENIKTWGQAGGILDILLSDPDGNRPAITRIRELCTTFPESDMFAACLLSDDLLKESRWVQGEEVWDTITLLAGLHDVKLSLGNGSRSEKTYSFLSESLDSLHKSIGEIPDKATGIELNQRFFKENVVLLPSEVDDALLKLQTDGTPFLLSTGYIGHHADILFFPNYVVVCNRGGGRPEDRKRSFAFGCDTQNLQAIELKRLVESDKLSQEEFTKEVYHCLPKAIASDRATTELVDMINGLHDRMNDQVIGNCWIPQVPTLIWWVNHLKTTYPDLSPEEVVAKASEMFRLIKTEQVKLATAKLQAIYDNKRTLSVEGASVKEFLEFIEDREVPSILNIQQN